MSKQNRKVTVEAEAEINWEALETLIHSDIYGLETEPMHVTQFTEGYSNLTFLLKIGNWEGVMRRPPFGKIPERAHDVEREFRILEKINPEFPLAPKPYLYKDQSEIMDKHFYIMEKKTGIVLDDNIPSFYENSPNLRHKISESVVDTLVQLHSVDYQKVGLDSLGKPDGYLERQVHGWIKRYHASQTDEIEIVNKIEKWLTTNIPASPKPTIVHNDYKLNNMMLSLSDPGKVIALFDWELCTVGDPLTDLGAAICYWKDENDPFTTINSVTSLGGFISRKEFMEMYAKKSGRDLSNFNFYLALAYFKTAVILQQIYYRWKNGHLQDDRIINLDISIKNLLNSSYESIHTKVI
ncbi:phosphotransferase family protein [Alkalihalobacterium alkalinitrilicum]|uniref:phosphotransferase family protein n=1 Tax=Alkalihalobacterium alkalinitrilicum TaxID=427920 RepID=UPI001EE429A1|nr:phosphotransferase family protein [Alkalihalobacterium alkalinitrilicum]